METRLDTKLLHSQIVKDLEKRANDRLAKKEMYYHKKVGKNFKAYGITAPAFVEIVGRYKVVFKKLGFDEKLKLARNLFDSGYTAQMSLGIILLEQALQDMNPQDFEVLEIAGNCLNNWGTVDGFCIDVLQPLLSKYPNEILALLRKWNTSENLWKRRASVVVFTRKIGASGRFTTEALDLCRNLMRDKEDLVQKAVGWALKDSMRGDKQKVLEFVKQLRRRGVSAVITLYAIRDLGGAERQEILKIRAQTSKISIKEQQTQRKGVP